MFIIRYIKKSNNCKVEHSSNYCTVVTKVKGGEVNRVSVCNDKS